jgi:para-aminobenzoate synthetase component 1
MNVCRFEDRLTGQARVLSGLRARITASCLDELPRAFAEIQAAQRSGAWIALLLDYELGEWLEPALMRSSQPFTNAHQPSKATQQNCKMEHKHGVNTHPRLTALVFDQMSLESPWDATDTLEAGVLTVQPAITHADYLERIGKIRQWIAQGEVYQINATFPMHVSTTGQADKLYRKIANQHPSAYAAYIEDLDRTVLSFSPELFIQRQGETLTTRPMKGTAPRAADPELDAQTGRGLQNSQKNRAENLMIVDLLRNDLGRIAIPGTVRAAPLFSLEQYPSVWTMTSTIQATIHQETRFETILKALFPCGSVTGAPKIAAMQRIQQTESHPRGLYCGSIGWLAPNGDFSLNVAIRTLVLADNGQGTYHVGGGIVHDSEAEQEWQECQWKARILTQELPALIETMRADHAGTIGLLPYHLKRLKDSAHALNYQWPGQEALMASIQQALSAAPDAGEQRVRLLLEPSGKFSIECASLPGLQTLPAIAIAPLRLNSTEPLLQHKTTYRPWYAPTTSWLASHIDFFDLIFLNERDELCEGSRSNIYIKKNGIWTTPPLTNGLLGGVQRAQLLDTQQATEGRLTREDLLKPGAQIRLSNGLRGWIDVRLETNSLLPGHVLP